LLEDELFILEEFLTKKKAVCYSQLEEEFIGLGTSSFS
jgi:hypothetical protein